MNWLKKAGKFGKDFVDGAIDGVVSGYKYVADRAYDFGAHKYDDVQDAKKDMKYSVDEAGRLIKDGHPLKAVGELARGTGNALVDVTGPHFEPGEATLGTVGTTTVFDRDLDPDEEAFLRAWADRVETEGKETAEDLNVSDLVFLQKYRKDYAEAHAAENASPLKKVADVIKQGADKMSERIAAADGIVKENDASEVQYEG